MRVVLAHLCFCEVYSVPEPPWETIDEFLAGLNPVAGYYSGKYICVVEGIAGG
jgi:hypothetical protein